VSSSAFRTTHSVPQGGLDARSQPDPNEQPVARLDQWLDVEVLRTWGAWAEISCSNGWTAWVDARALVAKPPPAPPVEAPPPPPPASEEGVSSTPETAAPMETAPPVGTPQTVPETTQVPTVAMLPTPPAYTPPPTYAQAATGAVATRSLPLVAIVGGAVAALGGFLPWFRAGGFSQDGFDVPVKFLIDYKTTGSGGLKVGMVVLAVAVVGSVLAALPGLGGWQRVCGWACVLVGVLYVVQIQRLLNTASPAPSLADTIGIGALIAVAGGLVLALAPGASK